MADRLARAETNIQQTAPGSGGGGGGAGLFWAISDGAAVATGTWPSLTAGTFTSDIRDMTMGSVATARPVKWYYLDPLMNAGALVLCTQAPDGSYIGLLESCTAVD